MNIRSSFPGREITPEAQADINRIMSIWRDCRSRFGEGNGDFLFGHFTIADAMYAPIVTRFRTYKIELEARGRNLLRDDHGDARDAGMGRRRQQRADDHRAVRVLAADCLQQPRARSLGVLAPNASRSSSASGNRAG